MKKRQYRQHTKGFSLLEMLLTTMIVSGLLVAVFNLLEDYAEKRLAESTAEYMENIALAVEDIIADPLYFQEAYGAADARPGDVIELSLADLTDGFGTIPGSTRLNDNIRNRTPMGSEIEILLRIADNPVDTTDSQAMEILVVTSEPILDERARRAATAAGPYGGLLRDAGEPIRSSFASWRVTMADLSGTDWANEVVATPPVLNETAYLVHYRHMSFDESAGDYMFRVSVPGRPELNRMYTNLNMGTHNIMGTDNLDLSGNLTLEGRAMINGDARIQGNTVIERGNVTASNRYNADSVVVNGGGGGVTGNLTVDDSINVNLLNLSGQLNARIAEFREGVDTTNQITAQDVVLQNGINSAGSINATRLQGNGTDPDIVIQGQMNASDYQTDTLTVQSGNVGTLDTVTEANLSVDGELRANDLGFGGVNVTTFGVCDRGC